MSDREQYPVAPKDVKERREWMRRRNAAIQGRGLRPTNGIDFGRGDRKGR